MDFSWTDQQLARYQEVVDFAKNELCDDVVQRDQSQSFAKELWNKCAELGLLRISVPKEYGGDDIDILSAVMTMEGLGYGCRDNGLTLALNAQAWTVQHPIVTFGSESQKKKYLPALCSGSLIGAHAVTEPLSGSDAYSLRTTAVQRDGGYILNGTKRLVTLAPIADLFLLFANTAPEHGRWGVTAFLIDRNSCGLSVSRNQEKMGLRTIPIGEIELADCFIPLEARLGNEGAGVAVSNSSLEFERSCMLASQLGAMQRQLEATVDYAREREQFNKPIGKFQSVSNRIADMKVRLEASRYLVYKVAWLKASGKTATMEASIAKLFLTESYVRSSEDALRIFGGNGYLCEHGVEREMRDAIGGVIYGGTSDIQRQVIARFLGL